MWLEGYKKCGGEEMDDMGVMQGLEVD